ncbi:MAG: hypothetical protein LBE22_04315 [Azoarcus sp.]|jgi:hypothetical protein|nr:hypothetical protein [Azoarcus sp.]
MRDKPVTPRCTSFWAISALTIAMAGPVQAKEVPAPTGPEMPYETAGRLLGFSKDGRKELNVPDPRDTTEALRALFAASSATIPASSSCHDNWRPTGESTVTDMLAMLLAYQYSGKNVILGNCHSGQCAVRITHAAGESRSSAIIVFNAEQGKARISSLECVITP